MQRRTNVLPTTSTTSAQHDLTAAPTTIVSSTSGGTTATPQHHFGTINNPSVSTSTISRASGGNNNNASTTTRSSIGNNNMSWLCSNTSLLLIASILTIITWITTPSSASMTAIEKEAKYVEHEVENWLNQHEHKQKQQSRKDTGTTTTQNNNNKRDNMYEIPETNTKWVDGEKKLKIELKKLMALQEEGKELGVPVLTRWLGDDIPGYAGTGVDVDEWNKKVKAAYSRMEQEEVIWKQQMMEYINNRNNKN